MRERLHRTDSALRRRLASAASVAFLCLLALAPAARAATTYTLDSGSIVLTVDEYSPTDGRLVRAADSVKIAIGSATVTLDPDLLAVDLLEIHATPGLELALYPGTPSSNDGYETLAIEAIDLSAVAGALLAGGGYGFDTSVDLDVTFGGVGGFQAAGGEAAATLSPGRLAPGSLYGDLGAGGPIKLSGVATGLFESPYGGSRFVVTANFKLSASSSAAPVPEPGAMLLFLAGLGVVSATTRRSRACGRWGSRPSGS